LDEIRQHSILAQRNIILAMLLAFAAAAWAVIVWHDYNSMGMARASVSGWYVALFIAAWGFMMVAMMFPSATPAVLAFHKAQAGRLQLNDAFVSTWLFVAAYLLVWWGFAIYAGAMAAGASGVSTSATATEVGGLILMLAGLYQLTPLKEFCLSRCRAPIEFIENSGRGWRASAFHMGLVHGLFCLGCYWLLFLALFPLGMSIAAIVAVSLVVLAEKTLPSPRIVTYATAAVLVLYGAVMSLTPQFLPTFGKDSNATAPAGMPMGMPRMAPPLK
jgi:predicted metal-binding membrane protein